MTQNVWAAVLIIGLGVPFLQSCGMVEQAFEANEPGPSPAGRSSAQMESEAAATESVVEKPRRSVEARVVAAVRRLTTRSRSRRLYREACATCHGLRGDGKGRSAAALDPEPSDFTPLGFYQHADPESESFTLDLFDVISNGIPGTTMPAWKKLLSSEDRRNLAQYIKSFSESG